MKRIYLALFCIAMARISVAQLDTIEPARLTLGMDIWALLSPKLSTLSVYGNQRLGRNQYVTAEVGFVLEDLNKANPRIDKIGGQRFSLVYQFQRDRRKFWNASYYFGISYDWDHLEGEGRTTFSRATGQFLQRYPYSTTEDYHSIGLNYGVIRYIGQHFSFEFGMKINKGKRKSQLKTDVPFDAILTDPDSVNLFKPLRSEDNGQFIDMRFSLRVGYVVW